MQALSRGNKKEMNHYRIVNLSLQEYIDPTDLGCVDTLQGFYTQDSRVTKVLQALLYDHWSGCDVVVLGEKALTKDADPVMTLSDGNWISYLKHYEKELGVEISLYDFILKSPLFKNVSKEVAVYEDAIGEDPALLVNGNLKEFLELGKISGTMVGVHSKKVSPVILLLTAGNGHGPGDYAGSGQEYAGRWLSDWSFAVDQIYCESEQISFYCEDLLSKGYKELLPDFRY